MRHIQQMHHYSLSGYITVFPGKVSKLESCQLNLRITAKSITLHLEHMTCWRWQRAN